MVGEDVPAFFLSSSLSVGVYLVESSSVAATLTCRVMVNVRLVALFGIAFESIDIRIATNH